MTAMGNMMNHASTFAMGSAARVKPDDHHHMGVEGQGYIVAESLLGMHSGIFDEDMLDEFEADFL